MKVKYLVALLILVPFSGCHLNSQAVKIQPTTTSAGSNVGKGATISTQVLDGRETNIIGNRGPDNVSGGPITALEDFTPAIKQSLDDSLRRKGFKIADTQQENIPHLTVEVRGIHYGWRSSGIGSDLKVESAVKALARKPTNSFERIYRTEKDGDTNWSPTAEFNEKLINNSLSESLTKLLDDSDLITFLTRKK